MGQHTSRPAQSFGIFSSLGAYEAHENRIKAREAKHDREISEAIELAKSQQPEG
jgi:hypothetical protein